MHILHLFLILCFGGDWNVTAFGNSLQLLPSVEKRKKLKAWRQVTTKDMESFPQCTGTSFR